MSVALHRLASITIGVPNVDETTRFYAEFGLTRDGALFSTSDGGEQLRHSDRPVGALDKPFVHVFPYQLIITGISNTRRACCGFRFNQNGP